MYSPKKAAEALSVSSDTIRRYCGLYGRHLSDGATPAKGKSRILSEEDVFLLRVAKQQTDLGLSVEEVDDFLDSVSIPEAAVAVQEEPFEVAEVGEAPEALVLMRQVVTSLDRIAAQGDRFDRLEEEVASLRRAVETIHVPAPAPVEDRRFNLSETVLGFGFGILTALGLAGIVAVIAWLIP